ncbi:MAG: hypothetical protein WCI30_03245 [Clostridia bacterium]
MLNEREKTNARHNLNMLTEKISAVLNAESEIKTVEAYRQLKDWSLNEYRKYIGCGEDGNFIKGFYFPMLDEIYSQILRDTKVTDDSELILETCNRAQIALYRWKDLY